MIVYIMYSTRKNAAIHEIAIVLDIHTVTVTKFLHISCFPPFCGANSVKCLLF